MIALPHRYCHHHGLASHEGSAFVFAQAELLKLISTSRLPKLLPSLFLLLEEVGSLLKIVLNLLNCNIIKLL